MHILLHPLFRRTLPLLLVCAGTAAFAATAFLAPLATPFLIVPIMVFFVVGAAAFLTPACLRTVVALPSLVSLLSLTLRPVRVGGLLAVVLEAGAARALALVGAVVAAELELAFEAVVTFLAPAFRVALAFSTMLVRTFVAPI